MEKNMEPKRALPILWKKFVPPARPEPRPVAHKITTASLAAAGAGGGWKNN